MMKTLFECGSKWC